MSLHYQRFGTGRVPLLFLHGGWGYDLYPIDAAATKLVGCTAYVPWRSGYGTSHARRGVRERLSSNRRARDDPPFCGPHLAGKSSDASHGDTATAR